MCVLLCSGFPDGVGLTVVFILQIDLCESIRQIAEIFRAFEFHRIVADLKCKLRITADSGLTQVNLKNEDYGKVQLVLRAV